jgi:hypothetical protein
MEYSRPLKIGSIPHVVHLAANNNNFRGQNDCCGVGRMKSRVSRVESGGRRKDVMLPYNIIPTGVVFESRFLTSFKIRQPMF